MQSGYPQQIDRWSWPKHEAAGWTHRPKDFHYLVFLRQRAGEWLASRVMFDRARSCGTVSQPSSDNIVLSHNSRDIVHCPRPTRISIWNTRRAFCLYRFLCHLSDRLLLLRHLSVVMCYPCCISSWICLSSGAPDPWNACPGFSFPTEVPLGKEVASRFRRPSW